MGNRISEEDALDLFKTLRIIEVSEEYVVLKFRHVEVYFDRETKCYDGIGTYVPKPRKACKRKKGK